MQLLEVESLTASLTSFHCSRLKVSVVVIDGCIFIHPWVEPPLPFLLTTRLDSETYNALTVHDVEHA